LLARDEARGARPCRSQPILPTITRRLRDLAHLGVPAAGLLDCAVDAPLMT
jgi:hypothetical protein